MCLRETCFVKQHTQNKTETIRLKKVGVEVSALEKFAARGSVWRTSTKEYQACQLRLVSLLGHVADQQRFTKFMAEANGRWAASTMATYWQAWLAAKKIIGEPETAEDARALRILERESKCAIRGDQQALDVAQLSRVIAGTASPQLRTAILVGWLLCQRISDVLQLHEKDVSLAHQHLSITFHRGKVVPVIGPFTVFLRLETYAAESLHRLARCRENMFLFSETNSVSERNRLTVQIRAILATVGITDVRSIRRGGVQHLGMLGASSQEIISLTKHSSEGMLMRYMQNGKTFLARANEQGLRAMEVEDAIFAHMTSAAHASGVVHKGKRPTGLFQSTVKK